MNTPTIKEVFFDWDGTFAHTEPVSLTVTHRVLSDYATEKFGNPMTAQIDALDMRGKDFGQIGKQFQDIINRGLPADQKSPLISKTCASTNCAPQPKKPC